MKSWTNWEIIRRQVAVAGRVMDHDEKPVPKARVTMAGMATKPAAAMPKSKGPVQAAGAGGQESTQGAEHTITREDGLYFFLDLPDGQYTVCATDPQSGRSVEKSASVSRDEGQNIKLQQVDFKWPA